MPGALFCEVTLDYFPKVETECPELPIVWNSLTWDEYIVGKRPAKFVGE